MIIIIFMQKLFQDQPGPPAQRLRPRGPATSRHSGTRAEPRLQALHAQKVGALAPRIRMQFLYTLALRCGLPSVRPARGSTCGPRQFAGPIILWSSYQPRARGRRLEPVAAVASSAGHSRRCAQLDSLEHYIGLPTPWQPPCQWAAHARAAPMAQMAWSSEPAPTSEE